MLQLIPRPATLPGRALPPLRPKDYQPEKPTAGACSRLPLGVCEYNPCTTSAGDCKRSPQRRKIDSRRGSRGSESNPAGVAEQGKRPALPNHSRQIKLPSVANRPDCDRDGWPPALVAACFAHRLRVSPFRSTVVQGLAGLCRLSCVPTPPSDTSRSNHFSIWAVIRVGIDVITALGHRTRRGCRH